MKFLCTADWHIRKEPPKYRIDNYLETLLQKVEHIVNRANELEATILIAGDIFDSPRLGYSVSNELTKVLKQADNKPISCFGNHDTTFHSQDLSNTPFSNLVVNGNIIAESTGFLPVGVAVTLVGWESELPEVRPEADVNILLGHISCFENTVPFWSTDGLTPETLKKKFPGFDYYVVGDIHIPFAKDNVINPGSLCRSTIDQVDYKPGYYILDTEDGSINREEIPVKPSSEVFNLDQKDIDELKDVKALNEFIHSIKYSGDRPNFRNVLNHVVKETKATQPVIDIITETLEEL